MAVDPVDIAPCRFAECYDKILQGGTTTSAQPSFCATDMPTAFEIKYVSLTTPNTVKVLGITIDDRLKFDEQVHNMYQRDSSQLKVMYRFKQVFKEMEKR